MSKDCNILIVNDIFYFMSFDCYMANSFMYSFYRGSEAHMQQGAIDMIYRFFVCGLIEPSHLNNFSYEKNKEEIIDYIQSLMKENPFSSNLDDFVHWYHWDLCRTGLFEELVDKYDLKVNDPNELNPEFAEEITALFLKHNVGLDVSPLVVLDVK